jgi:anti-anti-sigma regulatory factor
MSTVRTIQAHIAYELIGEAHPVVVAIEFLSREIAGPRQARELAEELTSLIRPDLPQSFVIDFSDVRFVGSTAFGEIVSFARKVGRVYVCNMQKYLRLGAAVVGLNEYAEFAANRQMAIEGAQKAAMRDVDDTADFPAFVVS